MKKSEFEVIFTPEGLVRKTLFTNFLRHMYKMKSNISSQNPSLLSMDFATGAFINPTIKIPGNAKAENYKKSAVTHAFSTHSVETKAQK